MKQSKMALLTNGIIRENALLVLMIGLCPALACSGTIRDGFGMGMAATFVLVCSNIVVAMVRKIVPEQIRIPIFIIIISTFVTIVDYTMQAYLPALSAVLGIFVPLIVVNCMILGRAEAFAYKNGIFDSILDGIGMGAGFTLCLSVMGAIRELLGNGTLFKGIIIGEKSLEVSVFGSNFEPMIFMILPPGAFLTIAFLIALVNWIKKRGEQA